MFPDYFNVIQEPLGSRLEPLTDTSSATGCDACLVSVVSFGCFILLPSM